MLTDSPMIWFKGNSDPQESLAGSIWIVIHSQIYNYVRLNEYILRQNKIKSALSYMDYIGFIIDKETLSSLSSMINSNLRRLKIKNFYFSLMEDNDPVKAINYMEKGRPLVIGIPYNSIKSFVKYRVFKDEIPENIRYYLTIFVYNDKVLLIPGFEGVELKTTIVDFYEKNKDVIMAMEINSFMEEIEKIKNKVKIIYASVLSKTGEELRSLNEYQ
ncbi:hypothetical protein [Ferroplasma sp.]|uniref:hypothetical protein n=1 Tax=Ferroplasma sp. TaxID=2591003 RepID=UPI00307CFC51